MAVPVMFSLHTYTYHVGRDSSVSIATHYGLDDPGSKLSGEDIFRTNPDRHWGSPKGDGISFMGVKRPKRGVHYPYQPSAEVKLRIELCLHSCGRSWPV
jgi:hypothetical protein